MDTENNLTYREQQLSDSIRRITSDLETIAPSDKPALQERIFSNVFMPLFAGEESMYKATFQTWVNFAGSPYIDVDVIDTNGKVLFTVPALFDRSTINANTNSPVSISHIVATAEQYSRIHPSQGSAYLNNELHKKATIMKMPDNVLKHLDIWNSIFKRYGRPEIMKLDIVEEVTVKEFSPDDFEPL